VANAMLGWFLGGVHVIKAENDKMVMNINQCEKPFNFSVV